MANTVTCHKSENPLTKSRLKFLTRIYHSAAYAGEATGINPNSLTRAATRFGLEFRMKPQKARDMSGSLSLDELQ